MSNLSNLSNGENIPSEGFSSFWWILRGLIAVITVVGNLLVVLLILTQSTLRKTQNWFVLSLAVADLLVGAILFPLQFVFEVLHQHRPNADHFVNFTHDFLLYASMTNLCSLTLDRYLSIIHPMKHIRYLTKRGNILKTIVTAWMLSFVFSFGDFIIHMYVKSTDSIAKGYHVFLLLFFIAFPCVSLPVAYFRILYFVHLHQSRIKRQAIQLQHNYSQKESERYKKNRTMIHVLGGIIGFFVISYLVLIYRAWLRYVQAVSSIDNTLSKVSFLILHSNSAINVFFYGIFKKDFRNAIVSLFCMYVYRVKYVGKFKDFASERRRTTEV